MAKKYQFTGDTQEYQGRTLRRIKRVSNGELGGWLESENNLSHRGDCWVSGDARVYDNARVSGNAEVFDNARVYDNAWVSDNARVYGNARVSGDDEIY